jgi:multiple sugar transport system ATP-binding protein
VYILRRIIMAKVVLKNIYKIYSGNVTAVQDCNLDIADKEFIVLVGPSGCGKSTTLRMIAGLEEISKGELFIGDKLCNDVAPKDRDIAMVFQNYALYPHMTVYENMAFGLKLRKMPKDVIDKKVKEAAAVLDIEHLLDRKPKALSGGQRQRVALGRAIVREPKVFLMDEPLSNLDAKLRVQMRTEISKLHKRLNTTFIYVTHDQTEAMTMGTRIVVMKDGLVQQVDSPQNIYENPTNIFVAGFIGSPQMNFAKSKIVKEGDVSYIVFGTAKLPIPTDKATHLEKLGYTGKEVIFGIRPEHLDDGDEFMREYGNATFDANVEVIEHMGSETYLYLTANDNNFVARVEPTSKAKLDGTVKLAVNMNKMHIFDIETEKTIV